MGVFNNIFTELAKSTPPGGRLMIDATHLKAHRTACVPPKKNRKDPPEYDKELYKQRNKVEIMFAASKTGVELPCAMTGVHTRFSQPSALPASSSFISINES